MLCGPVDVKFKECLLWNNETLSSAFSSEKPKPGRDNDEGKTPYKMIQTIGLSVGAAVAYIIAVLGLMFYCKKRRNAKRLQKGQDGEEPEMECLNGVCESVSVWWREYSSLYEHVCIQSSVL